MDDFDKYIIQGEPTQIEKSKIWKTAIGLQKVDGLTPSSYLIETAKENIEGKITIEEAKFRIDSYYKQEGKRKAVERGTEEADKVSANITEILSEKAFSFSPAQLLSIHKRLFSGVDGISVRVGEIRDYNITKSEWVLDGETVFYASSDDIKATLEYDFNREKNFSYKGLSQQEIVEHIAKFVSGIWQIHAFGEGNTRTIAVFAIKYLRTFGFGVENDMFAEHSWYFRNALVRANFNDYQKNIFATQKYLNRFFANILLGEKNELKNRHLHVRYTKTETDIELEKVPANAEKFPVTGKKFLVKGNKFPVIGLEIIKLIEKSPTITILELMKELNKSDRAIKNNLNKLREAGILVREGSDKKGIWKIIKNEGKKDE